MAQFDFLGVTLSDTELHNLKMAVSRAGSRFSTVRVTLCDVALAMPPTLANDYGTVWTASVPYADAMDEMHALGETLALLTALRQPETLNA